MTDTLTAPRPARASLDTATGWIARAADWLDRRGRVAWLAAMVLGFILFWPIGLGLLAYMIWSRRLNATTWPSARHGLGGSLRSSGNSAFDAYKADTLHRLEREQDAFEAFLKRLREAKDKAEFDQFMADRARPTPPAPSTDTRPGADT